MKVGIYLEPAGSGIGGAETMAAVIAEALAQDHQVDLLCRIPHLTLDNLAAVSGTSLAGVNLRQVEHPSPAAPKLRDSRTRYAAAQQWHSNLSTPYDLFIAIVHGKPPFCHAPIGILIVLYPTHTESYVQLRGSRVLRSIARHPFEYFYQNWEWRRRLETYDIKTAISEFSRKWTHRRWRVNCEILHPPVDVNFRHSPKEPLILSVGRFALESEGHTKRQKEMMSAFHQLEENGLRGWEYFSVGGLRATSEHEAYFENLKQHSAACRVQLAANIELEELKQLYERAIIFWHAAGYGVAEEASPMMMEHFGISTVEAMAAGCVPVVINKGGQREIVQHGVSGFLWDTVEELKQYTELLARDESLRTRMSAAARERAQLFSREKVIQKLFELLTPLQEAINLPQPPVS